MNTFINRLLGAERFALAGLLSDRLLQRDALSHTGRDNGTNHHTSDKQGWSGPPRPGMKNGHTFEGWLRSCFHSRRW